MSYSRSTKADPSTNETGWVQKLMQACRGPRALPALGALSFLESSLLPVPIDLAMVPICLARPKELWKVILVGALGSLAGAIFAYIVGAFFMGVIGDWLVSLCGMDESFAQFEALYAKEGWRAVAMAGITPIPFQVAALVSGAAAMPFHVFVLAVIGIRLLRFTLMAVVIKFCGAGLQKVLDKHGRGFAIFLIAASLLSILALPVIV